MAADKDLPPDGTLEGDIARRWQEAREHWSDWRDTARECFSFYAGHQWTDDELAFLREQSRPAITFNRIAPLVDAVLGHENNNRAEVRYIPRTQGDAKVSEMLTNASQYFRDQCDAEHEESDAFRDVLICGMGWTGVKLTDESNPEYDLANERIDPLEMLPDPGARKPNLADMRWLLREKRMTKEEIAELWPDVEVSGDPEWAAGGASSGDSSDPRRRYSSDGWDQSESRRKGNLVLEYWWRETEVFYVVTHPDTGASMPLPAEEYKSKREEIEASPVTVEMKRRRSWRRAFMIGNEIVQEDAPSPEHCAYTPITGKRDYQSGTWFGIVASLLDPQRMLNKWLSQMTNVINSNSQGGVMVEKTAVTNPDDFEEKWTHPRAVIWLEDGALSKDGGKIQPKPAPTYPAAFDRLYQLAEQAFMQVSGVNAELLGLADRDQPGVLEWQRKQSAVAMLAPIFDSLRRYRKMNGRAWLWYMNAYVSDGRIIRIVSDDGAEGFVPFWRDPAVSEYDVIVDQSSTAPNVKEQTWSVLIQLFPALKGMLDPSLLLLFLEYSPLPESLVSKLKENAAQKAQQPPPPDPKLLEAQASIQADQQKMQAQIQIQQQKQQADLALQQQKAEAELQMKRAELMSKLELAREEARANLMVERERTMLDHEAKVQGAQLTAGIDGQVAMVNAEADQQRNDALARAEMERGEALKAAEGDRTNALAQVLQAWGERQETAQQQQSETLAGMIASIAAGQQQLAGALSQMAEAQSAETELVRLPDGTKRTRKIKRKE